MATQPKSMQIWKGRPGDLKTVDAIYGTLREAIVSGEIRAGDRLIEEPLAHEFGVSRTPIREALVRLEIEQLVVGVPRRGIVVRGIDSQEMDEVYMIRIAVDGLAANLAAKKSTPVDVAKLRWINSQMKSAAKQDDIDLVAERNIEFHEALCEIAGNRMLVMFMGQVHSWVRRCEPNPFAYPRRGLQGADEHEAIIDAIAAGDSGRAEALTREHMLTSHDIRSRLLAGSKARSRQSLARSSKRKP